jgi:mannose-1-phosphate guanylyltransferase/phosphomannomutase
VLEPEVFEHIPTASRPTSPATCSPSCSSQGAPLFGFVADGYWEDVGSLEAYQRAHQDILDGRVKIDVRGFQVRPGIWLGEGAELDPDAVLTAPVLIGDFTKVEAGRPPARVHRGRLGRDREARRLPAPGDRARQRLHRPGTSLRGCVVGRSADVKQGGRVEDGWSSATTPTSGTAPSFSLM